MIIILSLLSEQVALPAADSRAHETTEELHYQCFLLLFRKWDFNFLTPKQAISFEILAPSVFFRKKLDHDYDIEKSENDPNEILTL